ncbi:Flagellar biosynthesis protein FlhA [hydrothermal vent metagenome]|uniref:Flagellar biosynthesis protein FlhA n=1 Tax=hydrothermal vent metagenome TaxID=652676 RepID=A0A3B1BZ10_9ZZZZ
MATAVARTEKTIFSKNADIGLAVGVVGILMVMVIPIPTQLLDILLASSVTLGLIVLLVVIYLKSPLEFSVFPSLLLILAIFRLSLNVASTRLILLHGSEGPDAAGKVIESFGQFVVGGNSIVGVVIFVILVIINYKVITQGSTRTSEVAARFTLDAMPGKQMSIDADLNAGAITDTEAKQRRKEMEEEASFYGAMDGALKFVKGDVIAGIIITVVNIVAGFAIGVLQQGMDLAEAAQVYTVLTVGDGLVSQLPSLVISTSAGLVVTRAAGAGNLGEELVEQLMISHRAFAIASAFLLFLAMIPGMPGVPFTGLGIAAGFIAYMLYQADEETKQAVVDEEKRIAETPPPEKVESLLPLDSLELEIGYELIPLVDAAQGGELLERIKSVRRQFALEIGIIVPPMHIRDNLQLKSNAYSILIKGVEVAKGELWINHHLAINPGTITQKVAGVETVDPTFGLPALWVTEANKERAKMAGYTVVDAATVITTHVKEIIKRSAHELLSRQDTQNLIDTYKETNPKVVEELIPGQLTLGQVQKVLQNLLREQVSVRDIGTILETLSDKALITKDTDGLTEYVRAALSRSISKSLRLDDGTLPVIVLDPTLENRVAGAVQQTEHGAYLSLEPELAQRMIDAIRSHSDKFDMLNASPVLLTGALVRIPIYRLTERFIPNLVVISHNELSPDTTINNLATVQV